MAAESRIAQALILTLLPAASAAAAELGSVDGFDVRLDTTLRASLGLRVGDQQSSLLANVNADDGDRAFTPGVISERIDATSQLDIVRGNLGFDVSADGWYDAIYHQRDDNRSPATFNPTSVPANEFPAAVRRLQGADIELQNAYVHDRLDIAGTAVTIRIGRQTLLWGESLFFPGDGIAGGQAPVDDIKAISQPLVEAREVYLPVTQADVRIQLPQDFSLEAYNQFEWRRDRTPGVASYFSTEDFLDTGGERLLTPTGALLRANDKTPGNFGQFGVALRHDTDGLDLGIYALRYDSKDPVFTAPSAAATTYRLVFPQHIGLAGISASTYLGNDTLAGEISTRWHMPLVSQASSCGPSTYATGTTLQALLSYDRQLRPGVFWNVATLDAEVVATGLLATETNPQSRLHRTTSFATAAEIVFTPQYFQILPNLDLAIPVGIALGTSGRSSVDPSQIAGTGNVTLSLSATYRTVWEAGVSFTHFIGPASDQPLADRDFITLTLGRTF